MTVCTRLIVLFLLLNIAGSSLSQSYGNVCYLPKKSGKCLAAIERYYFNMKSGLCQDFTYGGCGGNGNNFKTISECRKTCGCKAPAKTGRCRARFRRFFFDHKKGKCIRFIYGGCFANENNFRSKRACTKTCA